MQLRWRRGSRNERPTSRHSERLRVMFVHVCTYSSYYVGSRHLQPRLVLGSLWCRILCHLGASDFHYELSSRDSVYYYRYGKDLPSHVQRHWSSASLLQACRFLRCTCSALASRLYQLTWHTCTRSLPLMGELIVCNCKKEKKKKFMINTISATSCRSCAFSSRLDEISCHRHDRHY